MRAHVLLLCECRNESTVYNVFGFYEVVIMARLEKPVTRKQQCYGNPLLKIRSDQVFSQLTATISQSVLDLFPNSHRVFLEMLQAEAGVALESEEGGPVNYIIKGCFEQILLAKIKLEKCVIDLQMDFLANQFGENNPPLSSCIVPNEPTAPNGQPINQPAKLKKVPQRQMDKQKSAKTPNAVLKQNAAAAVKSPAKIKSRRKVGRPRKIQPSDNLTESGTQVEEPPIPNIAVPLIKQEKQDIEKYEDSASYVCNNGNVSPRFDTEYPKANMRRSLPVKCLEAEAERKAAEWLSVNSKVQENDMDNNNTNGVKEEQVDEDEQLFEYSCELCSYTAQREGQFLKHVLIHGKRDTVHMCEKCDFSSVSLNHYQRHKLSHSNSIFKCPQCSYQTDEAKQLARHVTVKHTMANIPPKRSSILQCTECKYKTAKIYHFERHLLVHNRDLKGLLQVYHCEMCPYKTHRKEHYLRHRDNVHLRHRPYQCNQCSRSYKREDALQQHKISTHNLLNGLLDLALTGSNSTSLNKTVAPESAILDMSKSPSIASVPECCTPGSSDVSTLSKTSPILPVHALQRVAAIL